MVTHFTELIVYRKSFELAGRIFVLSKRWPAEERYSLTDQIRRSSRAVGGNMAEAWGKRRYEAHFVCMLTDADGENHETEHWLLSAHHDGYMTDPDLTELVNAKREIGSLLGRMLLNPKPILLDSE